MTYQVQQSLKTYFIANNIFQNFDDTKDIMLKCYLWCSLQKRSVTSLENISRITLTFIEICCIESKNKIKFVNCFKLIINMFIFFVKRKYFNFFFIDEIQNSSKLKNCRKKTQLAYIIDFFNLYIFIMCEAIRINEHNLK